MSGENCGALNDDIVKHVNLNKIICISFNFLVTFGTQLPPMHQQQRYSKIKAFLRVFLQVLVEFNVKYNQVSI